MLKYKEKFPVLVCDIGDVLLSWRDARTMLATQIGKPVEEVVAVFHGMDRQSALGHVTRQQISRAYIEKLGLPGDWDVERNMWSKGRAPILPMFQLVEDAFEAHHRVAILSNAAHGSYEQVILDGHIPRRKYAAVVMSCDVHIEKPSKGIYVEMEKRLRVPRNDIFYVDDRADNVEAAIKRGWNAYKFDPDRPEECAKEIRELLGLR